MAPIVIEQALAQRLMRGVLMRLDQGREDVQPARVGLFPITIVNRLPDHLCKVVGLYRFLRRLRAHRRSIDVSVMVLLGSYEAEVAHAAQDVLLSLSCSLRVRNWIEPRRSLGQTSQHGGLR